MHGLDFKRWRGESDETLLQVQISHIESAWKKNGKQPEEEKKVSEECGINKLV